MTFINGQRRSRYEQTAIIPWSKPKAEAPPALSNTGKVLQGVPFKFNTPFVHDEKYKYIPDGAFDESLKSSRVVRMLLEHNDALEFGNSTSNLILHADTYGIAFRCHLRNDPISFQVRALADSKLFSECSIGFSYSASHTETRTISKTDVLFIYKATLHEISFLKAGACPETDAGIVDVKNTVPLFLDCKSLRLVSDNKFAEVMRRLRQISE